MPVTSSTPQSTETIAIPVREQCSSLCEACLVLVATEVCSDTERDLAVHEMRVATKRLRAAWHMVKEANPDLAKQRRNALRNLSAEIAGQRDQAVLLALAESLMTEDGEANEALTSLLQNLQRSSLSKTSETDIPVTTLREEWSQEFKAWKAIDLGDDHFQRRLVRNALRKSQLLALRRTRTALATGEAEVWHDWRKAVKRLRYQREFVAVSQARRSSVRDARISRLGTRLGERNDLANLTVSADEFLADGKLTNAHYAGIRKVIAQRERSILGNARRLGRLAFLR